MRNADGTSNGTYLPQHAKVAAAVLDVKPDALLSTEAPVDLSRRHFNHALPRRSGLGDGPGGFRCLTAQVR